MRKIQCINYTKVCNAARDLAPNFIALLNSPAPLVMGTDFAALSRIIERQTGIPTLFFNTNGMAFYDKGLADAWLALAKRFSGNQAWEAPPAINILGAVPLDLGHSGQLADLTGMLGNMGYGPISSFGMDGRFDQLGAASAAKLNLVIHVSGIKAAQYCKQAFGVPYIVHMPIGESGIKVLQCKIRQSLANTPQEKKPACRHSSHNGKRVLIIHEQITANGWRDCLQSEFGFQDVAVVSFFSMDKAYMQPDDIRLLEEADLQEIAKAYDYLFCDRILYEAAENPKAVLIEVPHLAVSGCYHWSESFRSIGSKGAEYLRAQLCL